VLRDLISMNNQKKTLRHKTKQRESPSLPNMVGNSEINGVQ